METQLEKFDTHYSGYFRAMASPCEVLMETKDKKLARKVLESVSLEAKRIESKFSRYLENNIIYQINHADGKAIALDDETSRLIQFADELHSLSDGLFDITSGVLREVWRFDGSDNIPSPSAVTEILPRIGWKKVAWQPPHLRLDKDMEIDLGGIGKEYAVDRCVNITREITDASVLVNFGGDLAMSGPRNNDGFWSVGRLVTGSSSVAAFFELRQGAIATSGDAHRFLLKQGKRYSHVLNPTTGWPVENPPHTVSVAAPTCVEAGMLSTLAMLKGSQAQAFLEQQNVNFWVN